MRRSNLEQSNSSGHHRPAGDRQAVPPPCTREPIPRPKWVAYLTEQGFEHIPALLGEVAQTDAAGTPTVLAVMQAFVFNQGDAWSWSRNLLERAVQTVIALPEGVPVDEQVDVAHEFGGAASVLGDGSPRCTSCWQERARMRRSRLITQARRTARLGRRRVARQLHSAYEALAALHDTQGPLRALVDGLLQRRETLLQLLPGLARAGLGSLCMRIHGDMHLGQVLVASGDVCFIDFEGRAGAPARRAARQEQPAARCGRTRALTGLPGSQRPRQRRRGPERARRGTQAGDHRALFIAWRRAPSSPPIPRRPAPCRTSGPAPENWRRLLDLFLLEKAAYEVCYEAANRPTWLGVPLRGLAALAERLLRG